LWQLVVARAGAAGVVPGLLPVRGPMQTTLDFRLKRVKLTLILNVVNLGQYCFDERILTDFFPIGKIVYR